MIHQPAGCNKGALLGVLILVGFENRILSLARKDAQDFVASFVLSAFKYNHAEKRRSITGSYVYRGTTTC
jgi:hypothetical protein